MDNWEEVKSAYKVAVLGTVTAASKSLGVHRATIIRHVDSLEAKLGQKLFMRHTNGYTRTEAGEDLVRVVKITDEQFQDLSGRIKGRSASVRGELIVTSLDVLAPLLLPSIAEFQKKYEETNTIFISTEQLLKIEYGEAHIALRPGLKPEEENNKVIPFGLLKFGLYAMPKYIEKYGHPASYEDLKNHRFLSRNGRPKTFFEKWIKENIPTENVVFQATTPFVLLQGLINGIGIAFLDIHLAQEHPELVEILPAKNEWHVPLWLIVHKDLYHTEKIGAFLEILDQRSIRESQ